MIAHQVFSQVFFGFHCPLGTFYRTNVLLIDLTHSELILLSLSERKKVFECVFVC